MMHPKDPAANRTESLGVPLAPLVHCHALTELAGFAAVAGATGGDISLRLRLQAHLLGLGHGGSAAHGDERPTTLPE
jgi:hypothetical protein